MKIEINGARQSHETMVMAMAKKTAAQIDGRRAITATVKKRSRGKRSRQKERVLNVRNVT